MRFLYSCLALFFVVVMLNSCALKQDQLLFAKKTTVPDSVLQKSSASMRNYRIKPQDILQIRNLENIKSIIDLNPRITNTDVSQNNSSVVPETYQVDDDGTVALTGLGHVAIAGLTRQEAAKKIEDLYTVKYFKEGKVTIDLKITNLNVTILGEVKGQGNFPLLKDKTTLIELLGEAGGITDRADEKNIKVIRAQNTAPLVMTVDLSDLKSISNPLIMQSGDVVYIAENKRAIQSDKNQTFSNIIQPIVLLLSTIAVVLALTRR